MALIRVHGGDERRYLLAAGTTSYLNGRPALPAVAEDVRLVVDTLVKRLGYERILDRLGEEPASGDLRLGFSEWLRSPERSADDVVMFYYAGHAEVQGEWHYLVTADTTGNLVATGFAVDEIARMLADPVVQVRRLLLVLDTCFAGLGALGVQRALQRIVDARAPWAQLEVVVLAAARGKETARDGCFTPALIDLLLAPRAGRDAPFLPIKPLAEQVSRLMKERGARQTAYMTDAGSEEARFFPNLLYLARLDRARRDMEAHFVPRAQGVPINGGGWLFTGRERACRELAAWLRERGPPNANSQMRVVTGSPGSGKSAVVSRFVVLANAETRALAPESACFADITPDVGAFDAAVHARRRTIEQVVEQVAEGFGLDPDNEDGIERLLSFVRASERRFVLALDALDEAQDPSGITHALLLPLAATAKVKILVGTLREQVRWLTGKCRVIDLDLDSYSDPGDLPAYVRGLLTLLNPSIADGRIARLTEAVGGQAGSNFLIANVLAEATAVSPDQGLENLPTTVGGAFDLYLARFGEDRQRVLDLLRPLAFAEGDGLVRDEVWPAVATAMTKGRRGYDDGDIVWLLEHAFSFLTPVQAGPDTAFRLFHEALARHLRSGLPARDAHQAFTNTLRRVTKAPRPFWSSNAYAQAHLATHSSRTGELNHLVLSPSFLLEAAPVRLLRALGTCTDPKACAVADVYNRAFHHLRGRPLGEAAAYLDFLAHCEEVTDLSIAIGRLSLERSWRIAWTRWQRSHPNRTVVVGRQGAMGLTKALTDRGIVHIVLGEDTIRTFDLDGGAPSEAPVPDGAALTCAAPWEQQGTTRLFTGGKDGIIRKWTVANGTVVPEGDFADAGRDVLALTVGQLRGDPIVLASSSAGEIIAWHAESGERIATLNHDGAVARSLECIEWLGSDLVLAAHDDGTVALWNPASGSQVATIAAHDGAAFGAASNIRGNRLDVVSCGMDGRLGFWNLKNGKLAGRKIAASGASLFSIALLPRQEGSLIVAGGQSSELHVWDLAGQKPVGDPLRGHSNWIMSVDFGDADGKPVAISAGADGTVRLWSFSASARSATPIQADLSPLAVVALRWGGKEFVASGGFGSALSLTEALTGRAAGEWPGTHNGTVQALAVARIDGRDVLGSAGEDGVVRLWEAPGVSTGLAQGRTVEGTGGLFALAFTQLEGRWFALAGGQGGLIAWWDLNGNASGSVFAGQGAIHALSAASHGDGCLVASAGQGGVRLWRPTVAEGGELALEQVPLDAEGSPTVAQSLAWVPSQREPTLVAGCPDGRIDVWEVLSGRLADGPRVGSTVRALLPVSRGSSRLVIGCGDGSLRSWRIGQASFGPVFETDASVVGLASTDRFVVAATSKGLVAYDDL